MILLLCGCIVTLHMSGNLITFIARLTDSMLLAATMDDSFEMEEYKAQSKRLLKTLNVQSPSRCTIEAGPYYYHYMIENGVIYMALAERSYPKRLAFQYLEEVHREFERSHGHEVSHFSRPYAAVSFDPKLSRIRRDFLDPRAPGNVKKLNSDLNEIHHIMSQNIQEVLKRGEQLESVQEKAGHLRAESKKFDKYARYLNLQHFYKTVGPVVAVGLVVLFVLYWRFIR